MSQVMGLPGRLPAFLGVSWASEGLRALPIPSVPIAVGIRVQVRREAEKE
ncbi:hypothetical protein VULLAG_LOCUS5073 [Vulpes lagopus]